MSTCSECANYDPIDADKGKCKYEHITRHVVPRELCLHEIINGWPIVSKDEPSCREFE